ncbi:MAG: glycosyltransferase [Pyrinomonadaceae bacterium]
MTFTGWLETDKKLAALQRASLLALPSYQENFGICVMEALALGVPVLISPHVNLAPEIDRAGAGWIAPVSRKDLSAVLKQALLSEDERSQRGRAAKVLATNYSWSIAGDRLVTLYRTLFA